MFKKFNVYETVFVGNSEISDENIVFADYSYPLPADVILDEQAIYGRKIHGNHMEGFWKVYQKGEFDITGHPVRLLSVEELNKIKEMPEQFNILLKVFYDYSYMSDEEAAVLNNAIYRLKTRLGLNGNREAVSSAVFEMLLNREVDIVQLLDIIQNPIVNEMENMVLAPTYVVWGWQKCAPIEFIDQNCGDMDGRYITISSAKDYERYKSAIVEGLSIEYKGDMMCITLGDEFNFTPTTVSNSLYNEAGHQDDCPLMWDDGISVRAETKKTYNHGYYGNYAVVVFVQILNSEQPPAAISKALEDGGIVLHEGQFVPASMPAWHSDGEENQNGLITVEFANFWCGKYPKEYMAKYPGREISDYEEFLQERARVTGYRDYVFVEDEDDEYDE